VHKSHGVVFSAEMVRALLAPPERRKTATRRLSGRWGQVSPGDHLWVREQHALFQSVHWPDLPHRRGEGIEGPPVAFYRAHFDRAPPNRWRSPIHMPRWAARIHLRVEAVSQGFLGMIGQHQAYAEGVFGEIDKVTGEVITSREVFLRKFREINPGLPWVEYNGMLFLEPDVRVWIMTFRAWEYANGCPWGIAEHPPVKEGQSAIPCPSCGLVG
jgi:hypothetical protein